MRIYLERVANISTGHPVNQTARRPDFWRGRAQFRDHPALRHVFRQREPGGDARSEAREQLPLPEMYDQVRGDRLRFNAAIGRLDLQLVSGFVIGQFLRSSYHTTVRIDHKLLRVYSLETIHDPRIFPVVVVHRFRTEHEIPFKGNGVFSDGVAYKRLYASFTSLCLIQVLLNAFGLVFSKDGYQSCQFFFVYFLFSLSFCFLGLKSFTWLGCAWHIGCISWTRKSRSIVVHVLYEDR